MIIFPIIKGQAELKTSKKDFILKLKGLTEKEYSLLRPMKISSNEKLKEYATELYDDSFLLWKIPSPGIQRSRFVFTVINGRLIENGDHLTLKYCIRFNIFSNVLVIGSIIATLYLLYDNVFLSDHFDFKFWFVIFPSYPLFIWIYRDKAKADVEFIRKLTA